MESVNFYNQKSWSRKAIISLAIVILTSINVFSINYYVSSKTGNDANDGKTKSTPWKTTSKVNSTMATFVAGDSILFEKGSIFSGNLVITRSGNSSAYLSFGAYGSGAAPVIKGSTEVTGWSLYKTNVWQATFANCPDSLTNLFINDQVQILGRQPNTGFYRITNISGSSIRDASLTLPSTDYYKGAKVAVKVINYIINVWGVTGSSTNGTISTDRGESFETDHGFIIMNHVNTLDAQGEWCFDKTNNKIYLYSTTDPSTKKVEVDYNRYGLSIKGKNYISVSGLEFTRHKTYGVNIYGCSNIKLTNNIISYSGGNGVRVSEANFITFERNLVTNTNNNGIEWLTVRDGLIKGNTISKTALIPGKGFNDNEQNCAIIFFRSSYGDIRGGSRNLCIENRIDSSGYNGIHTLWNDSLTIKNNYITNSLLTLDDGGAIYYVRDADEPKQKEIKIISNVIDYSYGNSEGTLDGYYPYWDNQAGEGIYLDNRACNALVQDNVITRTCKGIYLHNGESNILRNNVIYDCNTSTIYLKEDDGNYDFLYNNRVVRNKVYSDVEAGTDGRFLMYVKQESGTFDNTHVIDSNYYASPFYKEGMIDYTYYNSNGGGNGGLYNLQEWQSVKKFDLHSVEEPLTFDVSKSTKLNYSKLVYNPTGIAKTFTLSGKYVAFDGTKYINQITLQPYSGQIIFKDSRTDGTTDSADVDENNNFRWNPEFFSSFPSADINIYDIQGRLVSKMKGADYSAYKLKSELKPMQVYIYMIDLKNDSSPIKGKLVTSNLF